jgi:hypothetical protein
MRIDEAEETVYQILAQNWSLTPLAWHNVDARNYTLPGQPLLPDGTEDYLAVRLDIHAATTLTVPGHCIRYAGQLSLGICVKERTGTRQAKTYLSELADLLENQRLVSEHGTLMVSPLSNQGDYFAENGWYVLEAAFPIHFERYLVPGRVEVTS